MGSFGPCFSVKATQLVLIVTKFNIPQKLDIKRHHFILTTLNFNMTEFICFENKVALITGKVNSTVLFYTHFLRTKILYLQTQL